MNAASIKSTEARAYVIPTEEPESDGTLEWDTTTLVLVRAAAGNCEGIGYTYAHEAAAAYINRKLAPVISGLNAFNIDNAWHAMWRVVRNDGQCGLAAMAISAVDAALWDLKAKLLHLPLVTLLGEARSEVDIYGSGGFTSYDENRLCTQLAQWVESGIPRVKMKVGRNPSQAHSPADDHPDVKRVAAARKTIGESAQLMVDANGAYSRKQALHLAHRFAEQGNITWFEEPLPADDLDGLRLVRDSAPAQMEIAGGEYAYRIPDALRLIEASAVDCLMADATRCGGVTGFLRISHICEGRNIPLSAHTAPALHLHICCALSGVRHIEWFHDHVRIERILLDGAPEPRNGAVAPDLSRSGHGLAFKDADADQFLVP